MVTVTWMPDGREIVYASTPSAGFTPGLWTIAAAGGEPRRLPILGDGGVMPVVSPSGRRLIYVRRTIDTNIWRYERLERDGDSWRPRKLGASNQVQLTSLEPFGSPGSTRIETTRT
jgi:Tol biopolymer transport system component